MVFYSMFRIHGTNKLEAHANALVLQEYIKGMLPEKHYKVNLMTRNVSSESSVDMDVTIAKCPTIIHGWWRQWRLKRVLKRSRLGKQVEVLWEI